MCPRQHCADAKEATTWRGSGGRTRQGQLGHARCGRQRMKQRSSTAREGSDAGEEQPPRRSSMGGNRRSSKEEELGDGLGRGRCRRSQHGAERREVGEAGLDGFGRGPATGRRGASSWIKQRTPGAGSKAVGSRAGWWRRDPGAGSRQRRPAGQEQSRRDGAGGRLGARCGRCSRRPTAMASGGAREEREASMGGIEGERGFERGRWDRAERGAVTALRGNGRERLDRGIRLGFG